MNDVAIKHGQHLRQIARAAGDLDVGVFVIGWVNPEILRGAWHDLGQAKRADRGARADGEAAFLPDQGLQKAAPLLGRQARRAHAGHIVRFLSRANDQLFDGARGIAEHLGCAWVRVDRTIECFSCALRR